MKDKYYIGVDPVTSKSKGSIVVFNHTTQTVEYVKTMKWYKRFPWVNRLIYKYWVWKLYFKYYRRVRLVKETNLAKWEKEMNEVLAFNEMTKREAIADLMDFGEYRVD